ncbi:MAG: AAA family ATPase [Chloroflexota bacterium]
MLTNFQIHDLIALLRLRYPDWDNVSFPPFVADEIDYKRNIIAQADKALSKEAIDELLAAGDYDALLKTIERLGRATNLLYLRIPKASDLAVLKHEALNKAEFCAQFRNLLYGDQPSPQRLQFFSDYLTAQGLPNGWPFATYFLFITQPETEVFVKPNTAKWLLQFLGFAETSVRRPPTGSVYANILTAAQQIQQGFADYGAVDMVDVQSIVWVCARESKARVGRLNAEGQVALDIPPLEEAVVETAAHVVREKTAVYTPTLTDTTPYTLAELAKETAVSPETLTGWINAIRRKGQAIFYGPPGTGKTFLAQKLAQHLTSSEHGLVDIVQFHPAYSYEEFIQGLRPLSNLDGTLHYEMVPGRFINFCTEASRLSAPCVLIIDEINRANLAAVFGELMYLLEYRDKEIGLAAGNGRFKIPSNVIILGTMNTADRSIALVDFALRRRFAFIHLEPNLELIANYHAPLDTHPTLIQNLINLLTRLNQQINDPNYALGPSYFLQENLNETLESIWTMEIEPYLEEYFFDQPRRLDAFRWAAISNQLSVIGNQ